MAAGAGLKVEPDQEQVKVGVAARCSDGADQLGKFIVVERSATAASPTGLDQTGGRIDRREPGSVRAAEQRPQRGDTALPGGACRRVGATAASPSHRAGDDELQIAEAYLTDRGVAVACDEEPPVGPVGAAGGVAEAGRGDGHELRDRHRRC